MATVRDLVHACQREVRDAADLQPERAAEILMILASLLGNCADEIRAADSAYASVLLAFLESEEKANRAKIRAETSAEYERKREARDTRELIVELMRSLKYFLRSKQDEMQIGRHQ